MVPAVPDCVGSADLSDGQLGNEETILRCLGLSLVMQWDTLPANVQREIFDNAGMLGSGAERTRLRAQIARFLHKNKLG